MNQSKALVTLLLALLLGGGFYMWKMKTAKQVVIPVPEDLPIETPSDMSARYPQHIVPIEGTDEVWYQIPEFGVQMRLNKEFAEDLIYIYSKSDEKITKDEQKHVGPFHETLDFSSRSLVRQEPSCEPGTRAIGYFIKEEGDLKDWPTSTSTFYAGHTQFSNFFIILGIPNGEDNPKVPMCMLSETSKWSLLHTSEDERKRIERLVQDQSGMLWNGFESLEFTPQLNQ